MMLTTLAFSDFEQQLASIVIIEFETKPALHHRIQLNESYKMLFKRGL